MLKYYVGACLALVLSVGCGGSAPPASESPAEAPPAPPAAVEPANSAPAEESMPTGPVTIVLETTKGVIEFETFPVEAPKTVARILELVHSNFYRGLRFHRVVPGFVIQVGDPKTRDMTQRDRWGQPPAGTGTAIGVAEISDLHEHAHGAVAMAHAGDPAEADSQFYITMGAKPALDGKYTVFGQVTSGLDVVDRIEEGDAIRNMTVKAAEVTQ